MLATDARRMRLAVGARSGPPHSSRVRSRRGPGIRGISCLLMLAWLPGCWDLGAIDPPRQFVWSAIGFSPEEDEEEEHLPFVASAGLLAQGGRAEMSVGFTEAVPGEAYAWSVRSGACWETGDPVGPGPSVFPIVTIDELGEGNAFAETNISVTQIAHYSAEVYAHPRGPDDLPIACGTMEREN